MTVAEIKAAVMHQTGNDASDAADYSPHLLDYINEGYERLVFAYAGVHPSAEDETFPTLSADTDALLTPAWTHPAVADWATWCMYRNGNSQRQQRGYQFRASAETLFARVRNLGMSDEKKAKVRAFYNLPS